MCTHAAVVDFVRLAWLKIYAMQIAQCVKDKLKDLLKAKCLH